MSIKQKISNYLEENQEGASSLKISKRIKHSRLTVSKYLEVLRSEGKVDFSTVAQAKIWKKSSTSASKSRVLVVDDEPHIVNLIKLTLMEEFDVIEAYSGLDALEKTFMHMPDLIVLDIMMPGLNGYDVCERIKSNTTTKNIPILFLSAKSSLSDKFKGTDAGAEDYLTKPFDPEELRAMVTSTLQDNGISKRSFEERGNRTSIGSLLNSDKKNDDMHLYVFELEGFSSFKKKYGYKRGNAVLKLLSNLVAQKSSMNKEIRFTGNLHNNDTKRFYILSEGVFEEAKRIPKEFERFIPYIYNNQKQSSTKDRLSIKLKVVKRDQIKEEMRYR